MRFILDLSAKPACFLRFMTFDNYILNQTYDEVTAASFLNKEVAI